MIPPLCDVDCQNKKQLRLLKDAHDKDPTNLQKRTTYYTAKEGQGWLVNEKKRVAKEELDSVLTKYSADYEEVKTKLSSNKALLDMTKGISSQEKDSESNVQFLNTEVGKIKDKTNILNRQLELGGLTPSYIQYIIDAVYLVLGLLILFLIFSKMDIFKSYFTSATQNVVPNMSGT
jgi:hypothetical protein